MASSCAGGIAALTASSMIGCSVKDKGNPPNIIWLISEDTSPDIGCYGNELVATPNLDRLAGEGVRFANAFSSNPVCSPSRSAFMTGMYQTSIGAHQHRTKPAVPLPSHIRLVTEYFRDAGYYITNSSSIDFEKMGKTDWNFKPHTDKPFDSSDWRDRPPGQPFFAQVNFHLTHRIFERDEERPIDPDSVELPPYYPDHPVARRDWANYLESVQVLDRRIGIVLDRLDEDGLLENTIIFYFGDHGRPHVRGKQWLYDSGIHVPLIIRLPDGSNAGRVENGPVSLIDLGPTALNLAGLPIPGHMQGRPVLGPGATARDYIVSARDRCDMTIDRIRCVRTQQYKYIRNFHPERPYNQFSRYKDFFYPVQNLLTVLHERGELNDVQEKFMQPVKPREELYDVVRDPHEINNLAEDPAYSSTLVELRGILDRWMDETGDRGGEPENMQILENEEAARRQRYEKLWGQRGLSPDISPGDYLKFWEKELGVAE